MATKFKNRPSSSTPAAFPKFRCSWPNCSFTAKRLALLKNHVRNHNKEKPYKCHYCSYSSESRSNCKVHEQRMHTLQRPHKCHYCTYSCVQSSTLRQHVQIKHKDRCQYRCFQCRNFHCQRESQLMYHVLKVHQKTTVSEISPYLNPNFLPDYLPSMGGEMAPKQADDRRPAIGNSTVPQRPSQAGPRQCRQYSSAPTPCKLLRAPAVSFSSGSAALSTLSSRMSQAFHIQDTAKPSLPSASMWATGKRSSSGAQFRREQQTSRQASLNDLSEHSLLASSSLIAPLDDAPEVIEIIENDDEHGSTTPQEMQGSSGIYVCNHCLSTFPDEDSLLSHVLSVHPDTTTLQHCDTAQENPQQQDITHQDSITSSSSFVFTFPANQTSGMEMSPVPVSIPQDEFVVPTAVKQEDRVGPQVGQDVWPSVDDKAVSDAGTHHRERHSSETLPESGFANGQIHRSGSRSSHDSNFSQPVTAREGTPLLSMPSPTTTHSNRVTVSTQTAPSSTDRGVPNASQTKYCCVHCNIIFPDNVLFTIHRGAHGFHSAFECNFCGKDCGNKHEFASHLQNCS